MKYTLSSILLILYVASSWAQQTNIPLNSREYLLLDRWDVKSELGNHTSVKPISREAFVEAAKSASEAPSDAFDQKMIVRESSEYSDTVFRGKPILKKLYTNTADFYSVQKEGIDFHLNPIWVIGGGKENGTSETLFQNYRGFEMRGTIDEKVSFYSMMTENQARYPSYVRNVTDSTLGVPYEGFWKQYNVNGVDFLRAQGYVNVNFTEHINAQFGFGKHFIGDGVRSLILSDFGNNYPYLRLQTHIGRIQYTNLFAQLTGETKGGSFGLSGIGSFSRKYLALHHLDWQVTKNLTVGLFESVIFGKPDSLGANGWRMEYLNPIIFYRSVEQQDGSSDNAMIGLDFKWNLFKTVSLYGQLIIDELIVSEVLSNSDWWGNKQGYQIGMKYFDAFTVDNLNLQMEYNHVRPYVYAHETNYTSYSHYNMPLAHPLGANFQELLVIANYKVSAKLTATIKGLYAQYGNDRDSLSYGRDILKSYNLKTGEYGVSFLQGEKKTLTMAQILVSYQWASQLYSDLEFTSRKESSQFGTPDFKTTLLSLTLRYHFPYRSYLF